MNTRISFIASRFACCAVFMAAAGTLVADRLVTRHGPVSRIELVSISGGIPAYCWIHKDVNCQPANPDTGCGQRLCERAEGSFLYSCADNPEEKTNATGYPDCTSPPPGQPGKRDCWYSYTDYCVKKYKCQYVGTVHFTKFDDLCVVSQGKYYCKSGTVGPNVSTDTFDAYELDTASAPCTAPNK